MPTGSATDSSGIPSPVSRFTAPAKKPAYLKNPKSPRLMAADEATSHFARSRLPWANSRPIHFPWIKSTRVENSRRLMYTGSPQP